MPGRHRGAATRPSKYQPLADYLATQQADTLRLTLAEIEAILGFPRPTSADGLAGYWRDDTSARFRSLRTAGWQARLHRAERGVVFTRITPRAE